jgi:hypothetical protein
LSDNQLYLTPAILFAHGIERAAIEVEAAANGKPDRWWFAITDSHQALTAALVGTLRGTADIGAFYEPVRIAWLDYFERSRDDPTVKPPKDGYIMRFDDLLERAQCKDASHDMGGTLVLTEADKADLVRLNYLRNNLDHVRPGGWILEIVGLPRILGAAGEAMRQLFSMHPLRIHLEEDQIDPTESAIGVLLRQAGRV